MNFFTELFNNKIFMVAAAGWFAAQVIKTIIHFILSKEFVLERMVGSGGMPSSHSSTVSALATATYLEYGASSFEFAIAVILAIVVMHDARGVRRETGKQAILLNELIKSFDILGSKKLPEVKLKEFVGHTPIQVFAGILLGVINAFFMYYVVF